MLRALARIAVALFLLELLIMFALDATGIGEAFPSGKLLRNLLDSAVLVLASIPVIGWVLHRHAIAIERRKSAESNLQQLTDFDGLTGLASSGVLYREFETALVRAGEANGRLALIFLDLDRFKHVNETLGHQVGDELLRAVAKRIRACVRPHDVVCRLSGDEFIILLSSVELVEEVASVANELLVDVALPYSIREHELHMTASMGICVYPGDGSDRTTLMQNADTALYHAVELGGNFYQFYEAKMNASALERLALENALRHAVDRQQLRVHYQPQVSIQTGRIIGMEALVRWQHPDLGLMYPGDFIAMAELDGLIIEIGGWVLRTACQQARDWKDAGYDLRVGVNISPREFTQPDLEGRIVRVLHETGLDPRQLELEITESMAMSHPARTIAILKSLRELGVSIAIDDFGTGHSSLALLRDLPIDTLKIDKSFVRGIADDSADGAIAATVVTLAHRLGMRSIAEGVETVEQLALITSYECQEVQGYLFSLPLPSAEFEELLRAHVDPDFEFIPSEGSKVASAG